MQRNWLTYVCALIIKGGGGGITLFKNSDTVESVYVNQGNT